MKWRNGEGRGRDGGCSGWKGVRVRAITSLVFIVMVFLLIFDWQLRVAAEGTGEGKQAGTASHGREGGRL